MLEIKFNQEESTKQVTLHNVRETQLELRKTLFKIEKMRKAGDADIPAKMASSDLRYSLYHPSSRNFISNR